jgi:hypothetical protein
MFRPEAPEVKSPFSMSSDGMPRRAMSRAMPAPVAPPPMIKTSVRRSINLVRWVRPFSRTLVQTSSCPPIPCFFSSLAPDATMDGLFPWKIKYICNIFLSC